MIYENIVKEMRLKNYINEYGRVIFIKDEELLDEAFNMYDSYGNTIMVRNKKDDGISHHRTFKLKTRHYKKGIPIVFDKTDSGWEWKVDPIANIDNKTIKNNIGKKEIKFIDNVLELIGDEIIEYWKLDVKNKAEQERLDYLSKKYDGSKLK